MVNGWLEKPLGDLFDFSGGLSASRDDLSTKGYPYLHYGDIHGSTRTFVDVCADKSIPRLDIDLKKISNASLLDNGDVVFVDASEDDEGASRHIVVRNADDLPFISGLHTIIAKAKTDELDNKFREYCFQTALIKSQFKFYAVGTKVTGVSKTTIGKIVLTYPQDKSEQRRIAAVLSDTDDLIATLEKLIAKKRAIKQGTMQELLTGKRRLPGFSGEWVEKVNVFDFQKGSQYKALEMGKYPHYNGGQTNSNFSNDYNAQNKIIISEGGNSCGFVNYICGKFWAGGHCYVVDDSDFNKHYLFQLLKQCEPQIMALRVGSGLPNIQSKGLRELSICYTTNLEEQTAIASILSDMDAEIDALTAKLNKLRNIKQGMMSELLTGRIRLLEQEMR